MISAPVIRVLLRESLPAAALLRVPETDLVMTEPGHVEAFARAGLEDGVMAPMYLLHCAHVCELVRPGDLVLDLGCGPATQLAMIARLNPRARFLGLDLSDEMLDRVRNQLADRGLANVAVDKADMANLSGVADGSVDVVFSTMSLHHLPDVETLGATMAEAARVLKPNGALYVADFGRLKTEKSIQYFGNQYAHRQSPLFTADYIESLRAAFSKDEFRRVTERYFRGRARCYATPLAPFLVIVKSPARAAIDPALKAELDAMRRAMPDCHRTDIDDLTGWLRGGGLRTAYLQ